MTKVARSTGYRVAGRFREAGEAGLIDRREDNGNPKIDQDFLGRLWEVVGSSPPRYGWSRPTWTRELLVEVMRRVTGVRVTVWTMSRALQQIGGSPRASAAHGGLPVVGAGQTAETAAARGGWSRRSLTPRWPCTRTRSTST